MWVVHKYAGHLLWSQLQAIERNLSSIISDKWIEQHSLFIHMVAVAFWVHIGKTKNISFLAFLISALRYGWLLNLTFFQKIGENCQSFSHSPISERDWPSELCISLGQKLKWPIYVTHPVVLFVTDCLQGSKGCLNCSGSVLFINCHGWESKVQLKDFIPVYYIVNKSPDEIISG